MMTHFSRFLARKLNNEILGARESSTARLESDENFFFMFFAQELSCFFRLAHQPLTIKSDRLNMISLEIYVCAAVDWNNHKVRALST